MFEEINRRVSDLRWIYNIDYFPDGIVDTSKVLDFIKSGKKKQQFWIEIYLIDYLRLLQQVERIREGFKMLLY